MKPIKLQTQRKLRFIPFFNTLILFAYAHNSVCCKTSQLYNVKVSAISVGLVVILAIVYNICGAISPTPESSFSTVLFWSCYYISIILASKGIIKIQEEIGVPE